MLLKNKYSIKGNQWEVSEFYRNIYLGKFKYSIKIVIQEHHGTDLRNAVMHKQNDKCGHTEM